VHEVTGHVGGHPDLFHSRISTPWSQVSEHAGPQARSGSSWHTSSRCMWCSASRRIG